MAKRRFASSAPARPAARSVRGLYGAGQAAAQSGDTVKAKRYYARLVAVAGQGDPRPELTQARAFMAANP